MNVIKEFLTVFEKEVGYTLPSYGREAKGARRILDAGFTVEEALGCYRHIKRQNIWRGQHLSLTWVASNIAAWHQAYGKPDYDDDALAKWHEDNN